MTYRVEVQSEVTVPDQITDDLEKAAIATLENEAVPSAALTILLMDDKHMIQLNHDFRGLNHSTDVLSFPAGKTQLDIFEGVPYLGDVAISVSTARKQSQKSGHTVEAELQLLTVHGVLHLLGYDHLETEEQAQMWSKQEEILQALGLQNIMPIES